MKISNDGEPIFYKYYMRGETSIFAGRSLIVNPHDEEGSENYIFPAYTAPHFPNAGMGLTYTARLLGTDIEGVVCSSQDYPVENRDAAELGSDTLHYETQNARYAEDLIFNEVNTNIVIAECDYNFYDGDGRPYQQKRAPAHIATAQDIIVYPTLISDQVAPTLSINFADNEGAHQVAIYAMDGRKLVGHSFHVTAAGNVHKADVSMLAPGNYYVQLQKADGSYRKTFKISRL